MKRVQSFLCVCVCVCWKITTSRKEKYVKPRANEIPDSSAVNHRRPSVVNIFPKPFHFLLLFLIGFQETSKWSSSYSSGKDLKKN
jgi:hypothetical protein